MDQGTEQWHEARRGIPTASCYSKIITTLGKKSSQWQSYMNELIAESMGASIESFSNEWMKRGTEMEDEAVSWYEFETGSDVERVGFITALDGCTGGSPDGLVGNSKGLEIKCPKASTHVGYLRGDKLPSKYIAQVQGYMFLTERDEWDFVSYHPELPNLLITVKRDDVFIDHLRKSLTEFLIEINNAKNKLNRK